MAQPQAQQRRQRDFLQDLEHVTPPSVIDSSSPTSETEPEPIPTDTFPTSDIY